MDTYLIKDPEDGREYELDLDHEPTQDEADVAIRQIKSAQEPSRPPEEITADIAYAKQKQDQAQFPQMGQFPTKVGDVITKQAMLGPVAMLGPYGEALSRGVASTATGGISEAVIGKLESPTSSESAVMQSPYAMAAGETIGALLPTGRAAQIKSGMGLVKAGGEAGAIYGGAVGVGKVIEQGQTDPVGIALTIAKESSTGGLAGAALGAVGAMLPKIANLGQKLVDWNELRKAEREGRSYVPELVKKRIVDALNPRANAINPKMTVKAVADTGVAVERVAPELRLVEQESGSKFDSAQGATDVSRYAMKRVWEVVKDFLGQPVEIDLTPIAEDYMLVAQRDAVKTMFPDVVKQLEKTAQQYYEKKVPVQVAEEMNQAFNAINESLYNKMGGDRASAMKADPALAAGWQASSTLRKQINAQLDQATANLQNAHGVPFSELKKDYGAWNVINEHANKQAARQIKMEGKMTSIESVAMYDALRDVVLEGKFKPVEAMEKYAAGKIVKYLNTPDWQFKKAMLGFKSSPGVNIFSEVKKVKQAAQGGTPVSDLIQKEALTIGRVTYSQSYVDQAMASEAKDHPGLADQPAVLKQIVHDELKLDPNAYGKPSKEDKVKGFNEIEGKLAKLTKGTPEYEKLYKTRVNYPDPYRR
jgi:hypothetical protein